MPDEQLAEEVISDPYSVIVEWESLYSHTYGDEIIKDVLCEKH